MLTSGCALDEMAMSGAPFSTGVEATTTPSGLNVAAHEHHDKPGGISDSSRDSSTDRKCITHLFGRNKTCTRQIPLEFFELHARKQYQRLHYTRSEWPYEQLRLFNAVVKSLEGWGAVTGWNIVLKASVKAQIEKEDDGKASASEPGCVERFLLSYLGEEKSFSHVFSVASAIEEHLDETPKEKRVFPRVEFLPIIDEKEYPPRPLRVKESSSSLAIRVTKQHSSKPIKGKSKSSPSRKARDTKQRPSSRLKGKSKALPSPETLERYDLIKRWLKEKGEYNKPIIAQ